MTRTALVTGGSQGIGRGVVEALAEQDYVVHFTGRDEQRLAAVAADVAPLGGALRPHCVDHTRDEEVDALFVELSAAGERIDLLVNCVWAGYENMEENGRFTWIDPFWEQPPWRWDAMFGAGVRAAYVAAQHATRQMLDARTGLIVNLSFWAAQKHIANVLYGMAKAATDKMTADMAVELSGRGVNVVSMYPGLVRTEKVMVNADFLDLSNSESPRFIGRVIAALHQHPDRAASLSGQVCIAAALAADFGILDVDGRAPRPLGLADA